MFGILDLEILNSNNKHLNQQLYPQNKISYLLEKKTLMIHSAHLMSIINIKNK